MADRGPLGRRGGAPGVDGLCLHRGRLADAIGLPALGPGERAVLESSGHPHPVAHGRGLAVASARYVIDEPRRRVGVRLVARLRLGDAAPEIGRASCRERV